MGLWDSIKNIMIIPSEDELEETAEQEETTSARRTAETDTPSAFKKSESAPRIYQGGRNKNNASTVNDEVKIVLIKLERYDQTSDVADKILEKKTVILNLEETDGLNSRRILDFLTGAVYAVHGDIKKVANSTYVVAPAGVDLSGETLWDELRDTQNYF